MAARFCNRSHIPVVIVAFALAFTGSACSAFSAGYREPFVRN
jgi:hypothetical protein